MNSEMKKFLLVMVIGMLLFGCSKSDDESSNSVKAVVETNEPSEVKVVSAHLTANVNTPKLAEDRLGVTRYGFIVSSNSNPTRDNGVIYRCEEVKNNQYSLDVTNLAPNSKYYYVSYLYDGTSYFYGKVLSFTTKDFNPSSISYDAKSYETSVDLSAEIDFCIIGKLNDYRPVFSLNGNYTEYGVERNSNGIKYQYQTSIQSLSAETDYEYYFFLVYTDIENNIQMLSTIDKKNFRTSLSLSTGAVDLGLSVLWSGVNVGAKEPSDGGALFAWGEVEEKETYSSDTYKYKKQNIGKETDPGWGSGIKFYNICGTEFDASTQIMGKEWRMPTVDEIEELIDNCSWKYMRYSNKYGFLVTGKNGNRIFIPAVGQKIGNTIRGNDNYAYLWAGECQSDAYSKNCGALSISFYGGYLSRHTSAVYDGYYGHNIRPVRSKD